ncbi:response regulator transcription factor [bacterium]|nr:response regulator transcription factor [bacterium]
MNKQLTEREKEIMQYVCKGYTNKEIGKDIFVSINTVKREMSSILEKLHEETGQKLCTR